MTKRTERGKLQDGLAIGPDRAVRKNDRVTDEVMYEWATMICRYCSLLL